VEAARGRDPASTEGDGVMDEFNESELFWVAMAIVETNPHSNGSVLQTMQYIRSRARNGFENNEQTGYIETLGFCVTRYLIHDAAGVPHFAFKVTLSAWGIMKHLEKLRAKPLNGVRFTKYFKVTSPAAGRFYLQPIHRNADDFINEKNINVNVLSANEMAMVIDMFVKWKGNH
jgi:hypothetical protein